MGHARSCQLNRGGVECTCYLRAMWIEGQKLQQTVEWKPQKDMGGRALLYCAVCLQLSVGEPDQAVVVFNGQSLCLTHYRLTARPGDIRKVA